MKKTIERISNNILIFLFIILLIYLGYEKIINKSPFVKIFNIGILRVNSGSMMPELDVGEIIFIIEKQTYKAGDIVTYYTKEKNLITHRIIEKNDTGFITKGDFNNMQDEEILKKEDIQGKVIFHSKLLGVILNYHIVFILILIFLLCIKNKRS